MITVALLNPPSEAHYWRPVFYDAYGVYYPPDLLLSDKSWGLTIANDGYLDFRAITHRLDKSIIGIRDLIDVYVRDGWSYAYDWATNKWLESRAWVLVDSRTVSVKRGPEPVVGWQLAATRIISVGRGVVVVAGWIPVATRTISVGRGVVVVAGWIPVATRTISVARKVVAPPPPVEPPPEKKGLPLGPILIGAGTGVMLVAAVKPKKKDYPLTYR